MKQPASGGGWYTLLYTFARANPERWPNLGYWKSLPDTASWKFEGQQPGTYRGEANVAGKEASHVFINYGESWLTAGRGRARWL